MASHENRRKRPPRQHLQRERFILAFLYRTSRIQRGIAGLQAIQGVAGVESVDVSDIVSGHLRYRYLVGNILQRIGW